MVHQQVYAGRPGCHNFTVTKMARYLPAPVTAEGPNKFLPLMKTKSGFSCISKAPQVAEPWRFFF
jgi:hypothetical protein